jgi:hypothetical protein
MDKLIDQAVLLGKIEEKRLIAIELQKLANKYSKKADELNAKYKKLK